MTKLTDIEIKAKAVAIYNAHSSGGNMAAGKIGLDIAELVRAEYEAQLININQRVDLLEKENRKLQKMAIYWVPVDQVEPKVGTHYLAIDKWDTIAIKLRTSHSWVNMIKDEHYTHVALLDHIAFPKRPVEIKWEITEDAHENKYYSFLYKSVRYRIFSIVKRDKIAWRVECGKGQTYEKATLFEAKELIQTTVNAL